MIHILPLLIASAQSDSRDLHQLSWLAGSWFSDNGRVEEHWTSPREGLMVGMIRNLDRGSFYEYLRIEKTDQGVFYISQPKERSENRFKLVRVEPDRVVFEHVENRSLLRYQRKTPESFCGSLELADGDRFEWCWQRGSLLSN